MKLTVREIRSDEIDQIVDYFVKADAESLRGMGADKDKLPEKKEWVTKLKSQYNKLNAEKESYYVLWLYNNQAIGHSNINNIKFRESATMHLHIWNIDKRKKGLGIDFLRLTIPYYFRKFGLKKLICEPYFKNAGPNRVLQRLGFELVKTYETTPGSINFHQKVNRFELKKGQMNLE